jgi:hypothetical protein
MYEGIHLETHPSTQTDVQCLPCREWEGKGPHLSYHRSRSSYNLPHSTLPADVAAQMVQTFTFSRVAGSLPLLHGAND